jgi:hypothetical protein
MNIAKVASRLYLNLLGVTNDNVDVLGSTHSKVLDEVKASSGTLESKIQTLMLNNSKLGSRVFTRKGDCPDISKILSWVYVCQKASSDSVMELAKHFTEGWLSHVPIEFIEKIPVALSIFQKWKLPTYSGDETVNKKMVMEFIKMYGDDELEKAADAIPDRFCGMFVQAFYTDMPEFCTLADGCKKTEDLYINELKDHMHRTVNNVLCQLFERDTNAIIWAISNNLKIKIPDNPEKFKSALQTECNSGNSNVLEYIATNYSNYLNTK